MTGQPMERRQCTATSKQSGERCRRAPVPGLSVCVMHGGKSPAAQAKAAEVVAQEKAQALIERALWSGLATASPVKDPVASMERLAGALEQLVDEAGRRVSELKNVAGGRDLTQLRAEVTLLERALGHLRGLLVDMARLGIAERHVQLEQARAELVTAAFLSALEVGGLLPEVRTLMVERFLEQLGSATVVGEVVA